MLKSYYTSNYIEKLSQLEIDQIVKNYNIIGLALTNVQMYEQCDEKQIEIWENYLANEFYKQNDIIYNAKEAEEYFDNFTDPDNSIEFCGDYFTTGSQYRYDYDDLLSEFEKMISTPSSLFDDNIIKTVVGVEKCCNEPDIIMNNAGGEIFMVCRNCKSEVNDKGFKV